MAKQKTSPFYCYKKMCRKSALQTPEYMSDQDWIILKRFRDVIASMDVDAFMAMDCDRYAWHAFFNWMLGWPEGESYCHEREFVRKTFLPGMATNHILPEINRTLAKKGIE